MNRNTAYLFRQMKKLSIKLTSLRRLPYYRLKMIEETLNYGYGSEDLYQITGINFSNDTDVSRLFRPAEFSMLLTIERYLPKIFALTIMIRLIAYKQDIINRAKHVFAYPLVLFSCALSILGVFGFLLLPSMSRTLSFQQADKSVEILIPFIQWTFIIIGTILTVSVIIVLVNLRTRYFDIYRNIYLIYPASLWVRWHSFEFAILFLYLYRTGKSINEIMEILSIQTDSVVVFEIARIAVTKLGYGVSFLDSLYYLDPLLKQAMNRSSLNSEVEREIERYVQVVTTLMQERIQKIGNTVLGISYVMIILLLLSLYQILMIPLSIIQRL